MITLGGVELNPNLHLVGLENNLDLSFSIRETIGGSAVIQTEPRNVGATLQLVARYDKSSKMGNFCSHQIDSLKALAATRITYVLDHPAGVFNVKILTFNLTQTDERQTPGPNKSWHGEITLQEIV